MPINFPNNPQTYQTYTINNNTWIWNGSTWDIVNSNPQVVLPVSNNFTTVAVAGQPDVVADSADDTLNLVAGANITITSDASTDSITINSTASGGETSNSFATIAVAGQTSLTADSSTDTLTLSAGTGISISTDAALDTITLSSTASIDNLSELADAMAAGLTVDQIYLPAITKLVVTNTGASAYNFDQYVGGNPVIYALNGTTLAFKLNAAGHPFLIQTGAGANYDSGLTHVSTTGVVSSGSSAQGKDSGTLYWKVPNAISGNFRYQCSVHAAMVGTITIKNFGSI